MRRYLATAVLGAALLVGSGCGTDDDSLAQDVAAACDEYHRLLNQRSELYGNEMGAVGQAVAAGDEGRKDTAVTVIKELFLTTADGLREQSEAVTSDSELATALGEAADGLDDVASQIETYDDVVAADELMSESGFAAAGAQVSEICAG